MSLVITQGENNTVLVRMEADPEGTATVTFYPRNRNKLTIPSNVLTFNSSDWNVDKQLTVVAAPGDYLFADVIYGIRTSWNGVFSGEFTLEVEVLTVGVNDTSDGFMGVFLNNPATPGVHLCKFITIVTDASDPNTAFRTYTSAPGGSYTWGYKNLNTGSVGRQSVGDNDFNLIPKTPNVSETIVFFIGVSIGQTSDFFDPSEQDTGSGVWTVSVKYLSDGDYSDRSHNSTQKSITINKRVGFYTSADRVPKEPLKTEVLSSVGSIASQSASKSIDDIFTEIYWPFSVTILDPSSHNTSIGPSSVNSNRLSLTYNSTWSSSGTVSANISIESLQASFSDYTASPSLTMSNYSVLWEYADLNEYPTTDASVDREVLLGPTYGVEMNLRVTDS